MTEQDKNMIRSAINHRMEVVSESCNSTHILFNEGTVRGLLWALIGKDPGCHLFSNVERIYQLAEIPYRRVGNHMHYALDVPDIDAELSKPCEYCVEEGLAERAEV